MSEPANMKMETGIHHVEALGKGHKETTEGLILIPQPSDDPSDPLNWPAWKKNTTLGIWSFAAFSSQASAMANLQGYFLQAPLYRKTPVEVSYSISAALAGLIAGAILVVPLSRKFGTSLCLLWSTAGVLISQTWSALMTSPDQYNAFVVSRLFAGIFASVPLILGSQAVLHLFFQHERGKYFHILHIPYLLGVVAGPTIGGYIISRAAWPVQFWWTVGMNGALVLSIFAFLESTEYDRVQSSDQQPNMGQNVNRGRFDIYFRGRAIKDRVSWRECIHMLNNQILIAICPVSVMTGLFLLVDFGFSTMSYVLNVIFVSTPVEHGGYGFNSIQTASFTFSQWIGLWLAEIYGHFFSDRIPLWLCRRNGNIWKPEYRLYCLWLPAVILPIGLGIFASGLQYHLHWFVVALGSTLIFASGMSVVPVTMTYLCEVFSDFVPETSAIMGVYRLGFGLSTSFFSTAWIDAVGIGWVFGMAALFTVPAFAMILVLMFKGPSIRELSFGRVMTHSRIEEVETSNVSV